MSLSSLLGARPFAAFFARDDARMQCASQAWHDSRRPLQHQRYHCSHAGQGCCAVSFVLPRVRTRSLRAQLLPQSDGASDRQSGQLDRADLRRDVQT
jgi:hypothetical protein